MSVLKTPKESKMSWSSIPWARAKEWATKSGIGLKTKEGRGINFMRPFNSIQFPKKRDTS